MDNPEHIPLHQASESRAPANGYARLLATFAAISMATIAGLAFAGFTNGKQGSLATSVTPAEPRVFVHYMPWFRAEKLANGGIEWEHWKWFGKGEKHDPDTILENKRRDIASIYYPLAGPYDGRDAAVLEYHMLTAKSAGIDGFIADWYGPTNFADKVFSAMVKAAERYDMKVAICMEEKTFFPPYSNAKTITEAQDVMEDQIRHCLKVHASSPAYVRYHGQPVFYIFKNYGPTGTFSPKETAEVLSRFKIDKPLLVRGGGDPAYFESARGSYVWCPDGSSRDNYYKSTRGPWESQKFDYWVGGAYPGFDDHGCWGWGNGPRVVERNGTKVYEDTWNEVLRYRTPVIQISTWNDFEEGTTIEPSEQYGFTFIDSTEKFVGQYTGREVDLGDNQVPWHIYQLRKQVEQLSDTETQADWNLRLDKYSKAFSEGSRFLMGWRLRNLEADIHDAVEEANAQKKQNELEKGERKT